MKILKWGAVAVTALFVVMNAGVAFDPDSADWARVVGGALGVLGVVAAAGLAVGQPWGRGAVIAVGALNVGASIVGMVDGQEGSIIGLVLGALGVLLGSLAVERSEAGTATA